MASSTRLSLALWQLRDDLFDEIRAGAFKNPVPAKKLLGEIEAAARNDVALTPVQVLMMYAAARVSGYHVPGPSELHAKAREEEATSLAGLNPADRDLMVAKMSRLKGILSRYFLFGTYSGLIFFIFFGPVILVRVLLSKRGSADQRVHESFVESAKSEIKEDVPLDAALAYLLRHRDGHTSIV